MVKKSTKHLFVMFILFFCGCSNNAGTESELNRGNNIKSIEEFSEYFIIKLSSKDWVSVSDMVVNLEDIKNLYRIAQTSTGKSKEEIEANFINNPITNEVAKTTLAEIKVTFDALIKNGEADGIIWDQIKYNSCSYVLTKSAIEETDLKIKYEYKGNLYELNIPQVVKTNGVLKISSPIYSMEKSHKDAMREAIERSEKVLMDSIAKLESSH